MKLGRRIQIDGQRCFGPKVAQAGTEKAGPGPRCGLGVGEPAMRGWARPFCLPGRTDAVRA